MVSEVMMRRSVSVAMSYSQMFQVGWSSSSASSMNCARIANTTLRAVEVHVQVADVAEALGLRRAVMLISGADGEARSRMNRSAPISKRRSSRASSTMIVVFRIGDRALHVEHREVDRGRVRVLAAADRDVGAAAAAAAGREQRCTPPRAAQRRCRREPRVRSRAFDRVIDSDSITPLRTRRVASVVIRSTRHIASIPLSRSHRRAATNPAFFISHERVHPCSDVIVAHTADALDPVDSRVRRDAVAIVAARLHARAKWPVLSPQRDVWR